MRAATLGPAALRNPRGMPRERLRCAHGRRDAGWTRCLARHPGSCSGVGGPAADAHLRRREAQPGRVGRV